MDRRAKEQMVADLHAKLQTFDLAVLARYSGMNMAKMTMLRNALRKTGTEFTVVKNTLLWIASRETDFGALEEGFRGPVVIAVTRGDALEAAKVLADYTKKNNDLEVQAGVFQGKVLTREQLGELAELPSREVLLARLLSVMAGVPTALVRVLSGVPRGFVQVLQAYGNNKGSQN